MINVRFKKMFDTYDTLCDQGRIAEAADLVSKAISPDMPKVNIVRDYDFRTGKVVNTRIRGLDGNRDPKALIWRVYNILVNSQNATAESMAKTLRASKDRITHAIRDMRRAKNGSINVVFEDGYYRLAA